MSRWPGRDRLAWAAAVLGPVAVSLICVPFRARLANTHVALLSASL
ncbi:hypothetical protein ACFQO7_23735 [Catellatospora aurea]|uniref:Uncharacterized protein n=1 Tax=Catellatospora aurea TaxID=1337874 RepID=A0ABW2H2J0_9ACTN